VTPALEIGVGALAAIGFSYLVQSLAGRRGAVVYGIGLIAAALVYFVAALSGGHKSILTETLGLGIFSAMAIFSLRRAPILLALGWLLHVGWDLSAYPLTSASSMPHWYRWFCAGFDLVIAGYIVGRFGARGS
jgi:hypothetical protein